MVLKSRNYVFKMSMFILKSKVSVLQWWQILEGIGDGFGNPGHPLGYAPICR